MKRKKHNFKKTRNVNKRTDCIQRAHDLQVNVNVQKSFSHKSNFSSRFAKCSLTKSLTAFTKKKSP